MHDVSIILATTHGGLIAVADAGGITIIPDTERSFDSLVTFSDPLSTGAGQIRTGEPGWMALAI